MDMHGIIREYSYIQHYWNIIWEYSPEVHWELYPNAIYWEYLMGMFHEYSTDIHLPGGLYHKDKDKILKTEAAQIFFKIGVLKFRNVHRKTLVLESLINKF